MASGPQVRDDGPLQPRPLRQSVEMLKRIGHAEHELENVPVALDRPGHELEPALEPDDVRLGWQPIGELVVEQPGPAGSQSTPLIDKREVLAKESLRPLERVVASRRGHWARLRDVDADAEVPRPEPRAPTPRLLERIPPWAGVPGTEMEPVELQVARGRTPRPVGTRSPTTQHPRP